MTQNELITKDVAAIGEAISHELGAKMVKDYQDTFEGDVLGYQIGRNIIDQILAQPGCVGMRFYNGLNEMGQKTLVYVGVDAQNNNIYEYSVVNNDGNLVEIKATVADRSNVPTDTDNTTGWNWSELF